MCRVRHHVIYLFIYEYINICTNVSRNLISLGPLEILSRLRVASRILQDALRKKM